MKICIQVIYVFLVFHFSYIYAYTKSLRCCDFGRDCFMDFGLLKIFQLLLLCNTFGHSIHVIYELLNWIWGENKLSGFFLTWAWVVHVLVIYLFIYPICLFIYLLICIFIYLFVCLFIYLFTYLFIYLFIYLFTIISLLFYFSNFLLLSLFLLLLIIFMCYYYFNCFNHCYCFNIAFLYILTIEIAVIYTLHHTYIF